MSKTKITNFLLEFVDNPVTAYVSFYQLVVEYF